MRYAFAEFALDTDTRELRRDGRVVPLAPKAFDFLELLLRERPRAVSVTRLRAAVWPKTHVGATSLHVLVSQVRSALCDDPAESRWIRTVPRFGYAFCGTATGAEGGSSAPGPGSAKGPAFWLSTTEGDVRLSPGENVLGREAGLAARVDRPGVSRRHACIRVDGEQATLSDLGSKNGTFVNGKPVAAPAPLQDGDEIRLGLRATVVFRVSEGEETDTEVE
jgi:DNA-binding winged helix-turn-helix (wHTH) protein